VSFIADLGSTLEFMSICMIIFMINQIWLNIHVLTIRKGS
jgi:hypothetical protein